MRLVIDGRRLAGERTAEGRYLEVLLREWATSGPPLAKILVVLADRSGRDLVPETDAILVEVIGQGWPDRIWESFGLGRCLRPEDVLFAPTNSIPARWRGPTVLVAFATHREGLSGIFQGRTRGAMRRADRVLTPSQAAGRDVGRSYGVPAKRLRVIRPAPAPGFRPQGPGASEVLSARNRLGLGTGPFFLFAVEPSTQRYLPEVLQAFSLHRATHPGHLMVFAGTAHRDATFHENGIVRVGHLDEATHHGLMADAVALIYPSEDGFGLPIAEAMASGCPVITLRKEGLIEVGGDAAWYLDSSEPGTIAFAMHTLATDVATRAARMSRGFSLVAQLRPDRFAEEVKAEIRAVAGLHCHSSAIRGPMSRRLFDRQAPTRNWPR